MVSRALLILLLLGAVVSCAPDYYTVWEERSPSFDTSGVKKIAVLDFRNYTDNEAIARIITNELISKLVQSQSYIIVERGKIQDVLSELEFALSDIVDSSTGAKLGKLIGADAIITGDVINCNVEKYTSQELGTYYIGTRIHKRATVAAQLRVIDATTAKILWSNNALGDANTTGYVGVKERTADEKSASSSEQEQPAIKDDTGLAILAGLKVLEAISEAQAIKEEKQKFSTEALHDFALINKAMKQTVANLYLDLVPHRVPVTKIKK